MAESRRPGRAPAGSQRGRPRWRADLHGGPVAGRGEDAGRDLNRAQALAQRDDAGGLALDGVAEALVLHQQWLALRDRVADHVALGDAAEGAQRLPLGADRAIGIEGQVASERVGHEAATLAGDDGGPLLERA